ncbi:MAG: bifunctional diaminohydroxyphosphoribosylaminopyrimidine deaminase/5-amino-6-(5-phosphoribosylamino)uracil reductase RibD [Abditibacteriota bacterium]|nr:bifunctional diaminohydroxyphosphoribosylaminopyrimidine deaminase/5-amino-6-(5-phosphoribosylamino)uracil reductase RibD [Abditibacteriota bacterium]
MSRYMERALELAAKGRTSPNPKVGCVIVRDDVVVGEGFHPKAGMPHAEVYALRDAGDKAKGAEMYVTLEPCSHYGKTPPCANAVVAAGIRNVYVAMTDPDEKVSGRGIKILRDAGIEVEIGDCGDKARKLNESYIKHRTTGMPFVILKSAMTLDGRIATATGDSKWISCDKSRKFVHEMRAEVDAVLVGAGTARTDDPMLNARLENETLYPKRVVVTKSGNLPDLKMFHEPGETIVAVTGGALPSLNCRVLRAENLKDLFRRLGEEGVLSVLIEGGGETAWSALNEGVVDKVVYFYSPRLMGGRDAVPALGGEGVGKVKDAPRLKNIEVSRFDDDICVTGYL